MPSQPLDALPLWGLFLAILIVVLLSVEVGYRVGKGRERQPHEKEAPVGEMVGAMLGLLAFILAFTFGLAATRYDTRRQLVVEEANAIGTTYLRAGMLPEKRDDVRALLRDYVNVRLDAITPGRLAEGIKRSEDIQNRLWELTTAIAEKNPNSIVIGLFVQSLNETIDLHAKRLTAAVRSRVPSIIWAALYGISILSFAAMGYQSGLMGTVRSPAILAVAFTFSTVIFLIADLDRPQEGFLTVSQQAMSDLLRSME
jgi:Arc/MetJ family transcription regulator